MITHFLEVLNFNQFFFKLNRFLIVLLNTKCELRYSVTNTNINPTSFGILVIFGGDYRFTVL